MKNCYKKILIMFVMVLTIMGIGAIQNGITANAATLGEQLLQPEEGWTRYDNADSRILYNGFTQRTTNIPSAYKETDAWARTNESLTFKFYGTKLRVIGVFYDYASNDVEINIDGNSNTFDCSTFGGAIAKWQRLQYEKSGLELGYHYVTITNLESSEKCYYFDAIDIDKDGDLLPYDGSISLDKSSLSLKEGDSKKLTATTTPSAVDVTWSSSDETIATVDENGKVTGVKEGTCTVTAKIDGTDLTADCIVTVTKEDIVEPEEPSIESGSLYIEMVDGNIKRADKSQIEKFKKWFISRDLDETESPIFKITNAKGNVEYLVHDKIVGFEIRE